MSEQPPSIQDNNDSAGISVAPLEPSTRPMNPLLRDGADIMILTLMQFGWVAGFISLKTALVNLLPTVVFLTIWYGFIKREYGPKRFWWYLLPGFMLTLRLPITLMPWLEILNWLAYLVVLGLVFRKIFDYFREKQQVTLLVATALIILFNTVGHVSLDSPFTYGFRILNNLSSNYEGVDNNQTWECPYEHAAIAVSCDMRHFILTEKIFINADPQQAAQGVFLNRFLYGYLSSLIGFDGTRWIASISLNLVFWLLACVSMYRLCILTHLSQKVAAIAMLCCASGIGFIYFVGQPSPHTTAYTFAAITMGATMELICTSDRMKQLWLSLIIIAGPLIYEMYSITLTGFLLLLLCRRRIAGIAILLTQVLLTLFWRRVSLPIFLGTVGNTQNSGTQNLVRAIEAWVSMLTRVDINQGFHFIWKGLQSYFYGGLIVGAIASLVLIVHLVIKPNASNTLLLKFLVCLCLVTLAAAIFVSPDVARWNPVTGLQPRHSFFAYPAHTMAIAILSTWIFKKPYQYIPAVATFLIANLSLTGLISIEMLFDHGLVGMYWK